MAKDKCIMCAAETLYDETTHIDMRHGYVEGCGQLCKKCWDETTPKIEVEYMRIPRKIVLNIPNDQMLGEEIRRLFYQTQ